MEVTGIDGNYRLTCERVLRLLRNNNDSVLAVLESFVYDPVLNWRLTDGGAAAIAAREAAAKARWNLALHLNIDILFQSTTRRPNGHDRGRSQREKT